MHEHALADYHAMDRTCIKEDQDDFMLDVEN
jgi:hypothetical protein